MLVSIIIPCFNVESFIVECVDSVLNQSYKEIEIICIDNNSTDNTWNELIKTKEKYPSLIIEKEFKPGACAARNKGLVLAKGEWIQFLDADDLLLPDKIKHQLKLISKIKKESIAFIAASYIKRNLFNEESKQLMLEKNKYLAPFINQCGNTCSNLWHKQSILEVGGWNEDIKSSQETELMFKLVLNYKTYIIDELPLTIIRERESGQISQRNPSEKWGQYIEVRLNYLNEFKKNHLTEFNKIRSILFDFLIVSIITLWKYNKIKALLYYNLIKHDWESDYRFGFSKLKVLFIKCFGLNVFMRFK